MKNNFKKLEKEIEQQQQALAEDKARIEDAQSRIKQLQVEINNLNSTLKKCLAEDGPECGKTEAAIITQEQIVKRLKMKIEGIRETLPAIETGITAKEKELASILLSLAEKWLLGEIEKYDVESAAVVERIKRLGAAQAIFAEAGCPHRWQEILGDAARYMSHTRIFSIKYFNRGIADGTVRQFHLSDDFKVLVKKEIIG